MKDCYNEVTCCVMGIEIYFCYLLQCEWVLPRDKSEGCRLTHSPDKKANLHHVY